MWIEMRAKIAYPTLGLIAAWCCLTSCDSSEGAVDTSRCERVREHLVELELEPGDVRLDREIRGPIIRRALGEEFVSHCTREMTNEHVDCLLSADDSRAVAACSSQFTK